MILNKITLKNFRNLISETVAFSDGINVICGENAQGKTNILEAVWCLTARPSFRTSEDNLLIRQNQSRAAIFADTIERDIKRKIRLDITEKRQIKINAIPKTPKDLKEIFYAIIFSPDDLETVKGAKNGRRKMVDEIIETQVCKPL